MKKINNKEELKNFMEGLASYSSRKFFDEAVSKVFAYFENGGKEMLASVECEGFDSGDYATITFCYDIRIVKENSEPEQFFYKAEFACDEAGWEAVDYGIIKNKTTCQ